MKTFRERLMYRGDSAYIHYLCGYIPGRLGSDGLSGSILAFKEGTPREMAMWTAFAVEAFAQLDIDPDDLILRALSHSETEVDNESDSRSPLGTLCRSLADVYGCTYRNDILAKRRPTRRLRSLGRDDRWKELNGEYTIDREGSRLDFRKVWLVDDVITTGATARAIWKACLSPWPDMVLQVFALARTAHVPGTNDGLELESPGFAWKEGGLTLREPQSPYHSRRLSQHDLTSPVFDNTGTFIIT